jgi:hypothetical protein
MGMCEGRKGEEGGEGGGGEEEGGGRGEEEGGGRGGGGGGRKGGGRGGGGGGRKGWGRRRGGRRVGRRGGAVDGSKERGGAEVFVCVCMGGGVPGGVVVRADMPQWRCVLHQVVHRHPGCCLGGSIASVCVCVCERGHHC